MYNVHINLTKMFKSMSFMKFLSCVHNRNFINCNLDGIALNACANTDNHVIPIYRYTIFLTFTRNAELY